MTNRKKNTSNDITKTGPLSYRALLMENSKKFANPSIQEDPDFIKKYNQLLRQKTATYESYFNPESRYELSSFMKQDNGDYWGNSIWDDDVAIGYEYNTLGDTRADNQWGIAKIGAGLAKGTILAGTTFLDGTLGLLIGVGTAISEKRWSGLWDNDFSNTMLSINDLAEEALPNYYTEKEANNPLSWDSIWSANFLGDKLIKNLGFTIGAFYGGGVISKGIKGIGKLIASGVKRAGGSIKAAKNILNTSSIAAAGIGVTTSAVNEGRIEALNNSRDWVKALLERLGLEHENKLADLYEQYENGQLSEYELELLAKQEDSLYKGALAKVEENRLKMGNADLLMNLPILMASNLIQFGKLYGNGFKNIKLNPRIRGSLRDGYSVLGTSKLGRIGAITKGALSEGTEEIAQRAASEISGIKYENDVNNFYKAKFNDKATNDFTEWIKATALGISNTIGDRSAWEEFVIGSLTGFLGVPSFRSTKNALGKFQSPIYLRGGAYGEWKEQSKEIKDATELVNYMNRRVQSPSMLNYYLGMVRHEKYQEDMNKAVNENNEFDFRNAEHALLVSDINMFDRAGKLQDLKLVILEATGTSDEDLKLLVKDTTVKNDDGTLSGSYSAYAFINDLGEVDASFDTPEDKLILINSVNDSRKKMLDLIKQYQDSKDKILTSKYGDLLNNDLIEELTWMKTQLENWASRGESMADDIKEGLAVASGRLQALSRLGLDLVTRTDLLVRRLKEGRIDASISEEQLSLEELIKTLLGAISDLDYLRRLKPGILISELANNPKFIEGIISILDKVEDFDTEEYTTKLSDILKMGKAYLFYTSKLNEYINNPQKLQEAHESSQLEIISEKEQKDKGTFKDKLRAATTLNEFRTTLNSNQDAKDISPVLLELEDEGNQMAKAFRETTLYKDEVLEVLLSLVLDDLTRLDALMLFNDLLQYSNNLEELANPSSVHINNENAFLELSDGDEELANTRFNNASYYILSAMGQVNKSNKYKDKLSSDYQSPITVPKNTVVGDDTTGDSLTPIIPAVGENQNNNNLEKESNPDTINELSIPVGESSSIEIKEENRNINAATDLEDALDLDIYDFLRPSIPELHIEDSRQGDLRPFPEVVDEELFNLMFDLLLLDEKHKVSEYIKQNNIIKKSPRVIVEALRDNFGKIPEDILTLYNKYNQDFHIIYDYLKLEGAFDYVNQGKLHLNDIIRFMIDPRFEDLVLNEPWHTSPTIFMVVDNNGLWQVVGSLDESEYSAKRLKGLIELRKKVIEEYNNRNEKSKGRFIALSQVTTVTKLRPGKIDFNLEERSLRVIPGVLDGKEEPIFGIIQNGMMVTNRPDITIHYPLNMNNEGRLYLLIPNGSGSYSPAAIRVKHFNNEEFNIEDSTVANTLIGKSIKSALETLANAVSQTDATEAWKQLFQSLYVQDIMFTWFNADAGEGITISRKLRNPDGSYKKRTILLEDGTLKEEIEEFKIPIYFTEKREKVDIGGIEIDPNALNSLNIEAKRRSFDLIYNEIVKAITSFNLPIQVSSRMINLAKGYNRRLINSDVLTSNLNSATTISNWFNTNPPSEYIPENNLNPTNSSIGNSGGAIAGTEIFAAPYKGNNLETVFVDLKTNTIRDELGNILTDLDKEDEELIFDLAWIRELYSSIRDIPIKSVLVPSGKKLHYFLLRYDTPLDSNQVIVVLNKSISPNSAIDDISTLFDNKFRRISKYQINKEYPLWNKEEELAWLNKVLPQLTTLERVKLVEGLINAGSHGEKAWGLFDGAMVTLSELAAKGTTYHEAFHVVFNLLLTSEERQSLLDEYREKHPDMDNLSLEEELAEDFREFVENGGKDTRSLGRKIIDFFKSLFIKTKYWKNFRPSSTYYFRKINEGGYANRELGISTTSSFRGEEYSQEMKDILANAPRDENGNLLAPNGKPSNLNERQYAQVRTKAFKEWFGDWENNPENASKVVDENGEPLVVYHGGAKNINEFKHSTEENSNTGYGYYTDPKTGEKIPNDSARTIFFSNNKYTAQSYEQLYALNYYNSLYTKVEDTIGQFIGEAGFNKELFNNINEFYEFLTDLSELNPRFIKLRDYIKTLRLESKSLNPKEVEAARKLFIETRKDLRKYTSNINLNISAWNNQLNIGRKILNNYANGNSYNLAKKLKDGEIPLLISSIWNIYSKIKRNRDKLNLSKVDNYNEVIIWLSSPASIIEPCYRLVYKGEELLLDNTKEEREIPVSKLSVEEIMDFLKKANNENIKSINDRNKLNNEINNKFNNKAELYAVFLNIRNPLSYDYEGTHMGSGFKFNSKIPFGYIAARQVNKAIKEGYDGVIYENIYDPYLANNFGVFNSNQIKSATENIGTFDSNNPDIRYRKVPTIAQLRILKNSTYDKFNFDYLDSEILTELLNKGWTKEKFNLLSLEEKNNVINCIAF